MRLNSCQFMEMILVIKHLMKRDPDYLSIYLHFRISENWQATWCRNKREKECLQSVFCVFLSGFIVAVKVFMFFSYSRCLASLLSDQWWRSSFARAHLSSQASHSHIWSITMTEGVPEHDPSRHWAQEARSQKCNDFAIGPKFWEAECIGTFLSENSVACWPGSSWWSRLGAWWSSCRQRLGKVGGGWEPTSSWWRAASARTDSVFHHTAGSLCSLPSPLYPWFMTMKPTCQCISLWEHWNVSETYRLLPHCHRQAGILGSPWGFSLQSYRAESCRVHPW